MTGVDESADTPGPVDVAPLLAFATWAVIHLGRLLPGASSDLPAHSGGQPSSVCCLVLLQVGFTEPRQSPGVLVVSYTTVSP